MEFIEEIKILENTFRNKETYLTYIGNTDVLLTAVHTMDQLKEDGSYKFEEYYTKAIARYVAAKTDSSYFVKIKDTNIDSNSVILDDFKEQLLNYIEENDIKLIIDIHGAKEEREFDVEFGTLNNISADYSSIKELEDAFKEVGITKVQYNNPFKGGGITQTIFANTNIDVIQIEINAKYRNIEEPEKIKNICDALINFIKMYNNIVD